MAGRVLHSSGSRICPNPANTPFPQPPPPSRHAPTQHTHCTSHLSRPGERKDVHLMEAARVAQLSTQLGQLGAQLVNTAQSAAPVPCKESHWCARKHSAGENHQRSSCHSAGATAAAAGAPAAALSHGTHPPTHPPTMLRMHKRISKSKQALLPCAVLLVTTPVDTQPSKAVAPLLFAVLTHNVGVHVVTQHQLYKQRVGEGQHASSEISWAGRGPKVGGFGECERLQQQKKGRAI